MEDVKELEKVSYSGVALVVDDNNINAEIAMMQLESMGFTVERVDNGVRAVEQFGESPEGYYKLIIMDIMMPVMDGLEATRIIRKLGRSDAKNVPIIAITANAFPEDREASFENGVSSFITKPYGARQLREVVGTLLTA